MVGPIYRKKKKNNNYYNNDCRAQVNCRNYNAYGKRRRREVARNDEDALDSVQRGQLREEITIQSNAILTFERREERLTGPAEGKENNNNNNNLYAGVIVIFGTVYTNI